MVNKRTIARIAELFYINDLNQIEIAKKFNYSRAKVCRIIKEARKDSIIEFRINLDDSERRSIELEKKLEENYGLNEAIVLYNSDSQYNNEEIALKEIGGIGAEYIKKILKNDLKIALSWGYTLYNVIKKLNLKRKYDVGIYSSLGGVNLTSDTSQSNYLTQLMSEKVGGRSYPIYLPLFLDSSEQKEILLSRNYSKRTIFKPSEIDYYFSSIGFISKKSRGFTLGVFDTKLLEELKEKKIVGEIGLNFFKANGEFVKSGMENRIINLSIEDIRKIKNKVLIAFGKEKIASLRGFLKTGIANTVITDSRTAELLF